MKAILKEFNSDVQEAAKKTVETVSKQAVRTLKDTSPKRKGKYARGWARKTEKGRLATTVTVYNRSSGQLTHLLEHGHVVRNKKGTYGRAPAIPHIAPVEEWVVEETPKRFEEELNK